MTDYQNQSKIPGRRPSGIFNPKRKEALGVTPSDYKINRDAKVQTAQDLKIKKNYSQATRTKEKKNMNFSYDINVQDGSSRSFFRKTKKPGYGKMLLMKQTTRNSIVENDTRVITAKMGEQGTGTLKHLSPEILDVLMSSLPKQLSSTTESKQLFVHKVITNTTIRNNSDDSAEVTIRQIKPRKDLNTNMPWAAPVQAWIIGLNDETVNHNGNYNLVGTTPYVSNMFNKAFNVQQEIRVELPPQKVHIHTNEIYVNAEIYQELLEYTNSAVEGVTHFEVITGNGVPVARTNAKTRKKEVTTAPMELIITSKIMVHYYWTTDFSHSYSYLDRLPKLINNNNDDYNYDQRKGETEYQD